jgi:hypothetical protein
MRSALVVLVVTLASPLRAQRGRECAPRDTICWNAVYRADSMQRDSARRASRAKDKAESDSSWARAARRRGCAVGTFTWSVPQVGQTMCGVHQRAGEPDDETTVSLANGEVVYWYYHVYTKTRVVMFRNGRVIGVVW